MADVTIAEIKNPRARGRKTSIRRKTLRDSKGRAVQVLSLDANSTTLSDDLTLIFRRNVAKARKENKRLFGSATGFRSRTK